MSNHNGNANKMVGEDHIRDATKMVGDTPRTTDRVVFIDGNPWVNAPFARGLERELNAANDRIKRLEEAGNAMAIYAELGGIQLQFVGVVNAWREAKEAKP